ncbi:MAG: polysaccharide deacetylase family protein [Bacteroidia bacterium]
MIYILAQKYSPRLSYIADVMFGVILRTRFKILYITGPENTSGLPPESVLLNYTEYEIDGALKFPRETLLFEEDIKPQNPRIETGELLKIRFAKELSCKGTVINFDIFAAAFYLISEYENYLNTSFDEHERYDETKHPLYSKKLHTKPWVNIYAEWIWDKCVEKNPYIQREKNAFSYTVTFDIDSPFLYKHKPFWLQVGGFVKDAVKFDFKALKKRVKVLGDEDDPYDVTDYILQQLPGDKLAFFFLIDRHSPHDTRFTYESKIYRETIKRIATAGIECGIHPSYTSFLDAHKIIFEKEKLQEITGKKVYSARMHFLKYRLPQTYRHFIQATLTHDFTTCPIHTPGFKHFIAVPFLWFDLAKNTVSSLTLHPTMIMDRTLQKYNSFVPEQASEEIRKLIDETAFHNGHFVMLWHNSTLSDWQEWKGWRTVFEQTIQYLKAKV